MEFRLTYGGELLASNVGRDEKAARKAYKREVRRLFHGQLKRLWEIMPFLKTGYGSGPEIGGYVEMARPFHDKEAIARKFSLYGFNFLPLVTADLGLLCWLDILFLRRQPPGDPWKHGDIDNRLKTLFDCLTIPDAHQEYETISPGPDETPFSASAVIGPDNLAADSIEIFV
jgi:hypothetical protein